MNCSHIEAVKNETVARSVRAPGGWGAEESGTRPNRALRQRWPVSQASLARAWPNSGCIMKRANKAVISAAQNAAVKDTEHCA